MDLKGTPTPSVKRQRQCQCGRQIMGMDLGPILERHQLATWRLIRRLTLGVVIP